MPDSEPNDVKKVAVGLSNLMIEKTLLYPMRHMNSSKSSDTPSACSERPRRTSDTGQLVGAKVLPRLFTYIFGGMYP